MTRDEYLARLQQQIAALPIDEQNEAMDFYKNYFADANNDDAVMQELGSPEELANVIKQKFACVPATTQNEQESSSSDANGAGAKGTSSNGAQNGYRFGERDANGKNAVHFDPKDVRNLDIALNGAQVVIIAGTSFSIEARGITERDLRCTLSPYGTLAITNTLTAPDANRMFKNGSYNKKWHPRILITVPNESKLDTLKMHLGAGSFALKNVNINCSKAFANVGAGQMTLNAINTRRLDVHCGMGALNINCNATDYTTVQCGMGAIKVTGSISGDAKVQCGMGAITLKLAGDANTYSCDSKCAAGTVKFCGQKHKTFGDEKCTERKSNHFDINCGMGAISVDIA